MDNKEGIIINSNTLNQCKSDLKTYALYINRIRIMPSIKDGLKYIHRRIIYGAYYYEKAINKTVKSASIVGSVMKTMHPHGDTSIYDAMKPLTNDFEINMPLLKGKGNWGGFHGDTQAQMRYTESKLSDFCYDAVISELKENNQVIDWMETYDNSRLEPESLPVALPLLLINGSMGIGYGVRVDIPCHNINEVINATIQLIKNPNSKIILIPDQCSKCQIIETDFEKISKTGNGSFKVRGIVEISEYENNPALIIKSTPDKVFLNTILKNIEKLVKDNKLTAIQNIYDKSTQNNMNCIIKLKKGTDPNYMKDILYKTTSLQTSCYINIEALDGSNPVNLNYKSYLQSFIEYRKITKFRLYSNQYQKIKTKYHERIAYIKVLQSGEINNIVKKIQTQNTIDDDELIEYLIKKLNITDLQAKFIMNANIKKLSVGYLNKYIKESNEYNKLSKIYLNKIINDDIILQEIIDELEYYKKKYGKPRNCKIISKNEVNKIPEGEFKIIITNNNFIKKVPIKNGIGKFANDSPKFIIKVQNTENILLFDELGKVFKLPVHKIPMSLDKAINIRTIITKISNVSSVMYEPILKKLAKNKLKYFITILTHKGNIKKLDIEDFLAVPLSGLIYIKLDSDDFVKSVLTIPNGLDIIVYSKNKALRMNINEIPHQKRNTKGMKSMQEIEIDGLSIIYPSTTDIITITEKGYINRSNVVSLPCIGRNKEGCKVIKLHKNDSINSIFGLNESNTLRICTKNGKIDININDIEQGSSVSAGKKLIPMNNNNIIYCGILK